ncbi:MAG: tungsten ABC transporter substrate-binding protein [Betaproteobacteria bacterium]|nr:MAG: tungsten ABC transporter substrate-binding protein [Betaproteobacteria bacterium]
MKTLRRFNARAAVVALLLTCAAPSVQGTSIIVASTTSTEQSGLFAHLLPAFEKASGIKVKVVAAGTGQALDIGRRGDADIVFVHDPMAEERFVADGSGVSRTAVMYNDFVLVGPGSDPARAAGADIVSSFKAIFSARTNFVSRGDKSGTHAAELRFWAQAGVDPLTTKAAWYRDTGSAMGAALNTAAAMNAYVLTDRATWLAFKNRRDLKILVEGDSRLFNQYGVILVNPKKHAHVKAQAGQSFIDWLVSADGQSTIASYKIGGAQLFFPHAKK